MKSYQQKKMIEALNDHHDKAYSLTQYITGEKTYKGTQ